MANGDSKRKDAGTNSVSGQVSTPISLTPEVFDPLVGDVFRVRQQRYETAQTHANPLNVRDPGAPEEPETIVEVKLVEVTRYPKLRELEGGFEHRPREPFALLFIASHEDVLLSAVHTVVHEKLGELQLFLNPVQVSLDSAATEHPDGRFYETPIC